MIALPSRDYPGLVLAPGPTGRCDDYRVGGAAVDRDSVSGAWRMWYYCRDAAYARAAPPTLGSGRVAYATSYDGIVWKRVDGSEELGAILAPASDPTRFDCGHVGLTDVTRDGEGWRMWTFGGDFRRVAIASLGEVPGLAMRCGVAISDNGVVWQREPGPTPSGALFEIGADELYAGWPNAVVLADRTLLHYSAPTLDFAAFQTRVISLAPDGDVERLGDLAWLDEARAYDIAGIVTRHVIADPRRGRTGWLMAYTALDAAHGRSIALAESTDAIAWSRIGVVLKPGAAGSWDDCGVAANRLVVAGERLFLYYYGFRSLTSPDSPRGIGLAIADLRDPVQFDRYRA